jgi:hypothetical protein
MLNSSVDVARHAATDLEQGIRRDRESRLRSASAEEVVQMNIRQRPPMLTSRFGEFEMQAENKSEKIARSIPTVATPLAWKCN